MPAAKKEEEKVEVKKEQVYRAPAKLEPERNIYKWTAPLRPFIRKDRDFWVSVIAIASLGGLILFIIEGVMPVILIISLIFLYYILTTVEPEDIEYKITNYGIKIEDKRTDWGDIARFWFTKRFNTQLVIFEIFHMPGRLEFVINQKDREAVRSALKDYLEEEEAPPSYLDKAASWFSKKIPGNK